MIRRRGISIGVVLLVALALVVTVSIVAAVFTFQLNAAQTGLRREQALALAEGALSGTLSALHDQQQFGADGKGSVTFNKGGQVTFVQGGALPFSTNNLSGNNNVGWNGAPVPAGEADVWAVGTANGVTRTIEARVEVPPYPYVLSCAGALNAASGFQVKGASDWQTLAKGPNAWTDPASIGSNASIDVRAPCSITGDVVAPGSIQLDPASYVGGSVHSGTIDIPDIPVSSFDPGPAGVSVGSTPGSLSITQTSVSRGNLNVGGDLVVQDGVLFVAGSLTVTGSISGRGAVIVTGSTTVKNGVDLDASNQICLLSQGDVSLAGASKKYFQGLVYTQGRFTASGVTIAGTFIGGQIDLGPDVTVVYVPGATGSRAPGVAPQDLFLQAVTPSGQIVKPDKTLTGGFYPSLCGGDTPNRSILADAALGVMPAAGVGAYGMSRPQQYDAVFRGSGGSLQLSVGFAMNPDGSADCLYVLSLYYDAAKQQFVMKPVQNQFYYADASLSSYVPETPAQFSARHPDPNLIPFLNSYFLNLEGAVCTRANALLNVAAPAPVTPQTALDLDLNRFLRDTPPLKVVSWREP